MEIDTQEAVAGAELTPRQVVQELDKYIVGQAQAKRAVAIALRNRWRRKQVEPPLREEIAPKNIILIGPTGVGKTEIARRLARLAKAPFLKVEATKFTEVGYVGKDVESMIRDLLTVAVRMVRKEMEAKVVGRAREAVHQRILDALYPPGGNQDGTDSERSERTREKLARMLEQGNLDDRMIELDLKGSTGGNPPAVQLLGGGDLGSLGDNLQDLLSGFMPKQSVRRRVSVGEARILLEAEEAEGLVDQAQVSSEAIQRVEQDGIVFIDEIDKVAVGGDTGGGRGPDVSREGVQRDILPIVEGSTVNTRHGQVRTDHILFVAAGAFHVSKPSDLIPELQGRFPIRVELAALTEDDLRRILVEPQNSLIRQYQATLKTEGVELSFDEAAIERIAALAAQVNARHENIGARRLHTVLEALLEELSFEAPDRDDGEHRVKVEEVNQRLEPILEDEDLSRYIL